MCILYISFLFNITSLKRPFRSSAVIFVQNLMHYGLPRNPMIYNDDSILYGFIIMALFTFKSYLLPITCIS